MKSLKYTDRPEGHEISFGKKLEYCCSLREKGQNADKIKVRLAGEGYSDSEIAELLRESDKLYLEKLYRQAKKGKNAGFRNLLRTVSLFVSLLLVLATLLGYIQIGIIPLLIILSLLGTTGLSYSRRGSRFRD